MRKKRHQTRAQRTTIVNDIICFVLVLVVLQLWLLTATLNAYLGGDTSVVWPGPATRVICLFLNAGLLRHRMAKSALQSLRARAKLSRAPGPSVANAGEMPGHALCSHAD